MKKRKKMPPRVRLRELFDYRDGKLLHKTTRGGQKKGSVAGIINDRGYRVIGINGDKFKAHRLVWAWHHGDEPENIDHIDGDKSNNRITNLRACTHLDNCANRGAPPNNTSGIKGLSWHKRDKVWRARVAAGGKRYEKAFKDKDDAVKFVRELRERLHGEFANHG